VHNITTSISSSHPYIVLSYHLPGALISDPFLYGIKISCYGVVAHVSS
jgi:hypothetical protein